PGYAAPEQYGKAQTTARADIYSLGATLHQMLSGHDPSQNPFQFGPLRLGGQPGATELEKLVMQMVETTREKRPEDILAVKRELQRIAALQTASPSNAVVPSHSIPPQSSNSSL